MDMYGMTRERWEFLLNNYDEKLTDKEIADGWHFCPEFDGLLMRNNDQSCGVLKECVCGRPAR